MADTQETAGNAGMNTFEKELAELKRKLSEITCRIDSLEKRTDKIEIGFRDGLAAVNVNIDTFQQMLANMEKRLVEEKAKWGDLFRSIVKWTVRSLLIIVVYAAGVNLTKSILSGIIHF